MQQCLERGDLSPHEVAGILEEHGEQPQEIFRLIQGMKFSDTTEINTISKADIEDLRCRPLRLGDNEHIHRITLRNHPGEEVFVRTCKEYDDAMRGGYFAPDNLNLKMSVYFEHQCGLLKALEGARTPDTSFITDPWAGITDLHLLPFSFFPHIGDEHPAKDPRATYQGKVDEGSLIVRRLRQNMLVMEEAEGIGQQLIEVARADFNGDGIEDILVFEYCYATHGTLGFGGIRILTRKGPNGLFEPVAPCQSCDVTSCVPGDLSKPEIER